MTLESENERAGGERSVTDVPARIRNPEHWVEIFTAAFSGGSYEAVAPLARLTHPEYRGRQPQMPDAVGPEGLLEFFASVYSLIPDLRGEVLRSAVHDGAVYIEVRLSGTLGGRPVTWDACDRFAFRDGLVFARVTYLDPMPLLLAIATRPRTWLRWWRSGIGRPARRVGAPGRSRTLAKSTGKLP